MKTNKEKILKYLSGLMEGAEKEIFERELDSSEEMNAEFNKQKKLLSDFKELGEVEVNETYFVNLLPRVNEKTKYKGKAVNFIPKYALVFTFTVVIMITVFNVVNKNDNKELFTFDNSELNSNIIEAINESSDETVKDYISSITYYNDYSDLADLDISEDIMTKNILDINGSELSSYSLEDNIEQYNLNEEEFDELYNSVKSFEILGEVK